MDRGRMRVFAVGISLVVIYTVFTCCWGPYDSWLYFHIPIPFGWAMVFASLWSPDERDQGSGILLAGLVGYLSLVALNGSRNFDVYFGEAKTVARLACEDTRLTPNLKIYTNCNEGASQLRNYLLLERVCANPPIFHYLEGRRGPPEDLRPPYELIWTDRCDPIDPQAFPADHETALESWRIRKRYK